MASPKKKTIQPFCDNFENEFCDEECADCPYNDAGVCFGYEELHENERDEQEDEYKKEKENY